MILRLIEETDMLILGIESSGLVASVALADDDRLIAEYTMNNGKTHSQTLLPMIEELVRAAGLEKESLEAIAISRGPGSFTGLRIGSATAKGLGLALNIPLVEVSTLEALAFNLCATGDTYCVPIMDAKRNEVYTAVYRMDGGRYKAVMEESAMNISKLLDRLNTLGSEVVFVGDAVPVYAHIIAEELKVPYSFAPAHLLRQRAGSVAVLGNLMAAAGETVSSDEHAPVYLRLSSAEREKNEREGKA